MSCEQCKFLGSRCHYAQKGEFPTAEFIRTITIQCHPIFGSRTITTYLPKSKISHCASFTGFNQRDLTQGEMLELIKKADFEILIDGMVVSYSSKSLRRVGLLEVA